MREGEAKRRRLGQVGGGCSGQSNRKGVTLMAALGRVVGQKQEGERPSLAGMIPMEC